MRKIDKSKILSNKYKEWEEALGEPHPIYSTQNEFYVDVVMNLFHCQKGLCAYTETALCKHEFYDETHWKDGKYGHPKPKFKGDLEHFNSNLKKTKGWLWDNLLMADTNINRDKGTKIIYKILKPDEADYDEFRLFEYSLLTHEFIPNETTLNQEEQKQVEYMIDLLGINHPTVLQERRGKLKQAVNEIYDKKIETWESFLDENKTFPTALKMLKRIKETE